jgi:hypothetical protein
MHKTEKKKADELKFGATSASAAAAKARGRDSGLAGDEGDESDENGAAPKSMADVVGEEVKDIYIERAR